MSTQTLISTVTTRQYCASGRERDSGRLYESGFMKKNEKKRDSSDVQFSTDKKLATTQDRQTVQNSDEKQYCQYWILGLVVFTGFPAKRDCLLKLYMLVKSARTVSRELYWEKRVYIALTSYGYLRVLRQYFASVQNLSSCCLPSAYCIVD